VTEGNEDETEIAEDASATIVDSIWKRGIDISLKWRFRPTLPVGVGSDNRLEDSVTDL